MIGVVIPAHNEEELLPACLRSLRVASQASALRGEAVRVVVVLDRCSDETGAVAHAWGSETVRLDSGNVGRARAAGAEYLLAKGARWLAMTDADSMVPADWLSQQLASGADAFCGTVKVSDWLDYPLAMVDAFVGRHVVADGHPHVHGANMGVSAAWYLRCGGFPPIGVSEDVALIDSLARAGARIERRVSPIVITSARRDARARGGFSDYLRAMEADLSA